MYGFGARREKCGSADHWIKDCPHKPTQMGQSAGSQRYGSQSQSSSSGNKGQSTRSQPRPQSGQKGDKGRGKGKGKSKKDVKKMFGKTPSGTKNKPAARALDGEEEDENENEDEYEEEDSEQYSDPQEEEDGEYQDDGKWWNQPPETEQPDTE